MCFFNKATMVSNCKNFIGEIKVIFEFLVFIEDNIIAIE
jgi:hypothetical protein